MLSPKGLWFSSGGKLLYSFLRTDRGCLNRMIIIMDYVLHTRYCFVWYGTYEAIFPFKFRKVIVITLSLSLSVCLFVCLFVRSFKSKWSPNVNLLILNAKLKEGEKKKKVLITNFSLGVLFNRAISLNTSLVDMNLQIKKKLNNNMLL